MTSVNTPIVILHGVPSSYAWDWDESWDGKTQAYEKSLPVGARSSATEISLPTAESPSNRLDLRGAPLSSRTVMPEVAVKPGMELRILPLGDSITFGFPSSDGNSYRLVLFEDLSGTFHGLVLRQRIMSYIPS